MQFIECHEGKLEVLIIEGNPTIIELQAAWMEIKSEHIAKIGDADTQFKIEKEVDKSDFETKQAVVKALLSILKGKYDERVIKELQEWGYDYSFTEDTYIEDIDRVLAELASEAIEYTETEEKELKTGKSIRDQYINTIRTLQKTVGLAPGKTQLQAAKECTMLEYDLALLEHNELAKQRRNTQTTDDGDE